MNEDDERLIEFDETVQRQSRAYWEALTAKGDPDAVAKHDAFLAAARDARARVVAGSEAIDGAAELTRQALMNVIIAHRMGDHGEVERLIAEHEAALEQMPDL